MTRHPSAKAMDKGGWRTLPAEGLRGERPEWPLTEPTEREDEVWHELWTKPQAVVWEDRVQAL
ncbi:hypothetical protein [Actinacidiphila glaucinigra]